MGLVIMLEPTLIKKLESLMPSHTIEVSTSREGRIFLLVDKGNLKDVISCLKEEGFTHLAGITALETDDVFELLYHLSRRGTLLTVRVNLPLNDDTVPTITDVIPGALLYEREIHDLFGVKFEGHPNLEPLILPNDWPKDVYPLRKNGTTKRREAKEESKPPRTDV